MSQDNWKGGDGNWLTTGDWSTGAVPSNRDHVDLSGSRHVTITRNANVAVHSLEVDSTATLDITNLSTFDAVDGLPFGVFGFINVEDSVLEVQGGTINNSEEIEVTSINTNSDLTIDGTVALNGAGSINLNGIGESGIIGALGSSAALTNDDNNISGGGLISGLAFTNDATVETNNNFGAFTLQITGNAEGGFFDNIGNLFADNGGTLVFGESTGTTQVAIVNNGLIALKSSGAVTALEIVNNVKIEGGAFSRILLEGTDAANDEIVSNGHSASLTLDSGELSGAGTLGDANLTLTVNSDVIADGTLDINTGANTIVNEAAGQIISDVGDNFLNIESPIQNAGLLEAAGGGITFNQAVTNMGTPSYIDAIGGSITFVKSVTNDGTIHVGNGTITVDSSIIGTGNSQIEIDNGGLLDLAVGGTVTQGVTFVSPRGTLELDQNTGQIGTEIYGIEAGDSIDLKFHKLASGDHPVWVQAGNEGNLEVVTSNGSIVANLVLAGYGTPRISPSAPIPAATPRSASWRRQCIRASRPPLPRTSCSATMQPATPGSTRSATGPMSAGRVSAPPHLPQRWPGLATSTATARPTSSTAAPPPATPGSMPSTTARTAAGSTSARPQPPIAWSGSAISRTAAPMMCCTATTPPATPGSMRSSMAPTPAGTTSVHPRPPTPWSASVVFSATTPTTSSIAATPLATPASTIWPTASTPAGTISACLRRPTAWSGQATSSATAPTISSIATT